MRSLIFSQCRDLRIGGTREDLGAGSAQNASISLMTCMITWSQIARSHLSGFVKVATRLSWIKGQKETD